MTSMTISPLLGALLPIITQYLKNAGWFKLVNPEQKSRIQALSTLLAAVGSLTAAYASGSFDQNVVGGLLDAAYSFVTTWGLGTGIYHYFMKEKSPA